MIPPSEACLPDHIKWSLAQAHHQSSVGLSQSFPPKRGGKARPQTGFHFTVQKRPMSGSVPGPGGTSFAKRPHLECGNELIQVARSLLVAVCPPVLLRLGERGPWGSVLLMCQSPQLLQPPHHLHLQLFRLVCFSNFLINSKALHPTGLSLIWFGVTIFSLGLVLSCSLTTINLMSRWLQLIILLFRRRLISFLGREQLNPPLVVLVSILAFLWFLSILGASNPYLA